MTLARQRTKRTGEEVRRRQGGAAGCQPRYFSYVPKRVCRDRAPLVFVHGYNRNARDQLELLRPLADRLERVLLAPYFAKEQHPRYQRLGKGTDGERADSYFDSCLREAAGELQVATQRIVLIGFSGGAQFAHRYGMLHPHRVEKLIAVAAGWYTFPDCDTPYPRGLDVRGKLRRANPNPESFLAVPTTVIVGEEDRDDTNLRHGDRLDRQQGSTRVERARRWVLAMRMAARRYGVSADIVYQEVPGMDHDFERFVVHGRLRELLLMGLGEAHRETATARRGQVHVPAC